jgi:hypothetical protein
LEGSTFTGTQNLNGNLLNYPVLQKTCEVRATATIASEILALDLSNGISGVSLNANITSVTLSNNVASSTVVQSHTIEFTGDGTARTVAWPSGNGTSTLKFLWPNGTVPVLTATTGKVDTITIKSRTQFLWDAYISGQNS